jgi:processive 1,2-diacylglycerol beta-glucosyltransferase
MRYLTDKELEVFRRDYQDKEREIQRYIGVYLSGLVLVTGWIIGPQSRPLLLMALGNDGYNIYAFLIFVVLNIIFTNFLIFKSIIIHEITQFMTVVAKPDSGFVYWDSWRRSPQSATKPVRAIYTSTLTVLPIAVSFLMMFGVWNLLKTDPNQLANRISVLEAPIAAERIGSKDGKDEVGSVAERIQAPSTSLSAEQLASVLGKARVWFWIVLGLHVIPFAFFYVNVVPTNKRWQEILRVRGSRSLFKNLSVPTPSDRQSAKSIRLVDNETGQEITEITYEQLTFLIDNLEEETATDTTYYFQESTVTMLEQRGADSEIIRALLKAIGKKDGIEIRWEYGT